MSWKLLTPLLALACYVVGLVAHEGTHVLAVWLTGSELRYVSMVPPEVGYVAPTSHRDALVRFSTVLVTLPMLVACLIFIRAGAAWWRLLGLAVVAGYIPRSESDWEPLTQCVKWLAVKH